MTWHAEPDLLARFATDPNAIDDANASSIEMHMLECATCRAAIARATAPDDEIASWAAIADRIDAPAISIGERVLRRFGVSADSARLVAATRSLQLSWLGALALVVALAVLTARNTGSDGPFLALAPLVPLALVAAAFAAGADPAGESASATPVAGVGLVVRRSVAVVSVALLVLAAGSLALPDLTLTAAAWVLPALGLGLGTLALGTWVRVERAAAGLAVAWLAALYVTFGLADRGTKVTELAPIAATGQVTCACLAIAGAIVLVARREQLGMSVGESR